MLLFLRYTEKVEVILNKISLCLEDVLPRKRTRGSSVSIVSDYGLDGLGSTPDRGRGFSL
jgi:hypothetical protein